MRLPSLSSILSGMLGQQTQDPMAALSAAFPAGVERIAPLLQRPLVAEDQGAMRHFFPGQNGPSFPPMPQGPPMADPFAGPPQIPPMPHYPEQTLEQSMDLERRLQAEARNLASREGGQAAVNMLPMRQGQAPPQIAPAMLENQRRTQATMGNTAPAAQQGPPLPRMPGFNELLAERAQKLLDERNLPAAFRIANRLDGLPQWQGVPDNAGLPLEMQQQRLGRMGPQERGRYMNMHTTINPSTGAIRPATPWQPNLGGIGDGGARARLAAEQQRIAANSLSNDLAMQQRRSGPFDTNAERMEANRQEALTPGTAALLQTMPSMTSFLEGRAPTAMDLANQEVMNRLTGGEWMRLQLQQRDERNAGSLPNELARRTVPLRSADDIARRKFDRQVRADRQRERTPEQVARFEEHMRDLTNRYKLAKTPAQRRALVTLRAAEAAKSRDWRMGGGRERLMAQQQWFNDNPDLAYKYAMLGSDERRALAQMNNANAIAGRTAAIAQGRNRLMGQQITDARSAREAERDTERRKMVFTLADNYQIEHGLPADVARRRAEEEVGVLYGPAPTAVSVPGVVPTAPTAPAVPVRAPATMGPAPVAAPMAALLGPAEARLALGEDAFVQVAKLGTDYGQFPTGAFGGDLSPWHASRNMTADLGRLADRLATMQAQGVFSDSQIPAVNASLRSTLDPQVLRAIERADGSTPGIALLQRLLRGQPGAFAPLTAAERQQIHNAAPSWYE